MLERLLADPPRVHQLGTTEADVGVLATDRDCYAFIAANCRAEDRTLETGLGLSTALFASLGARHTCVTPSADEVARLRAYCDERAIGTDGLTFAIGGSADVLPGLVRDPLDLVLIDGGHGFPLPMIDWYYGAGRLRRRGVVVVDDIHLPAVRLLVDFLEADPRWTRLARTSKWGAWRRENEGSPAEEWVDQPFLAMPDPPPGPARAWFEEHAPALVPVLRPAARVARRVADRLVNRRP